MAFNKPKFSIASLSLGSCTHHSLPKKIHIAADLGYDGMEIFIPDFEAFVSEASTGVHDSLFLRPIQGLSQANLEHACASAIARLCASRGLAIPCLQPFRNFENFPTPESVAPALVDAERWFNLMSIMGIKLLLVCSNYIPGSNPVGPSGSFASLQDYLDAQVDAFKRLGALAAQYECKVGYESLAWGTVVHRWENVWDVVKRVDMDNVGIILDSFNTLGRQYADPSTSNALLSATELSKLPHSMSQLHRCIPGEKLFLYQVADAQRPAGPIEDESQEGRPARMKWSRASRLFPCESSATTVPTSQTRPFHTPAYTGFLPLPLMTSSVIRTGYTGFWSLEVYNNSLMEEDEGCPRRHGVRGMKGLKELWDISAKSLDVKETPTVPMTKPVLHKLKPVTNWAPLGTNSPRSVSPNWSFAPMEWRPSTLSQSPISLA